MRVVNGDTLLLAGPAEFLPFRTAVIGIPLAVELGIGQHCASPACGYRLPVIPESVCPAGLIQESQIVACIVDDDIALANRCEKCRQDVRAVKPWRGGDMRVSDAVNSCRVSRYRLCRPQQRVDQHLAGAIHDRELDNFSSATQARRLGIQDNPVVTCDDCSQKVDAHHVHPAISHKRHTYYATYG